MNKLLAVGLLVISAPVTEEVVIACKVELRAYTTLYHEAQGLCEDSHMHKALMICDYSIITPRKLHCCRASHLVSFTIPEVTIYLRVMIKKYEGEHDFHGNTNDHRLLRSLKNEQ